MSATVDRLASRRAEEVAARRAELVAAYRSQRQAEREARLAAPQATDVDLVGHVVGRRARLRRSPLAVVFAMAAFVLVGVGAALAAQYPGAMSASAAYQGSPVCPIAAEAQVSPCTARFPVTVASIVRSVFPGAENSAVMIRGVPGSRSAVRALIVYPPQAAAGLRAGEKVDLKVWDGRRTSLLVPGSNALLLADNPIADRDVAFIAGLGLIAVGGITLIVLLPALRPAPVSPGGRRLPSLELHATVSDVLRDWQMRAALLCFAILQALDVATTFAGARHGLEEGNAAIALLIGHVGYLGFLALKVPTVIILVLALVRLPRRAGIVMMWGANLIMVGVVASNIGLINAAALHP